MIHVYCGEGKGKTTAAIGLAVRHAGSGGKVLFVQFMKCSDTGELHAFEKIPQITVLRNLCKHGFSFSMTDEEKAIVTASHNQNLVSAWGAVQSGACTMLVLDEIASAYDLNLINREQVDSLIDRIGTVELILTGRNPSQHMLEKADYITEMKSVRHPYQTNGTKARKGIEF